jgi:hypothetical protein
MISELDREPFLTEDEKKWKQITIAMQTGPPTAYSCDHPDCIPLGRQQVNYCEICFCCWTETPCKADLHDSSFFPHIPDVLECPDCKAENDELEAREEQHRMTNSPPPLFACAHVRCATPVQGRDSLCRECGESGYSTGGLVLGIAYHHYCDACEAWEHVNATCGEGLPQHSNTNPLRHRLSKRLFVNSSDDPSSGGSRSKVKYWQNTSDQYQYHGGIHTSLTSRDFTIVWIYLHAQVLKINLMAADRAPWQCNFVKHTEESTPYMNGHLMWIIMEHTELGFRNSFIEYDEVLQIDYDTSAARLLGFMGLNSEDRKLASHSLYLFSKDDIEQRLRIVMVDYVCNSGQFCELFPTWADGSLTAKEKEDYKQIWEIGIDESDIQILSSLPPFSQTNHDGLDLVSRIIHNHGTDQ